MRTDSKSYRRDYLRALAQRVEVDAKELRIMGSKARSCARWSVPRAQRRPSLVPKWRTRHDSNVWPSPSERTRHRCSIRHTHAQRQICAAVGIVRPWPRKMLAFSLAFVEIAQKYIS